MSPYMNIEECAEYVKLSVSTLYKKSSKKEIPVRKHGSLLLFHRDDIDAWSISRAKPVEEKKTSRFQQAKERVREGRECA